MPTECYKVSDYGSILCEDHTTVLPPGRKFKLGEYALGPKSIKEHLRSGFLIEVKAPGDERIPGIGDLVNFHDAVSDAAKGDEAAEKQDTKASKMREEDVTPPPVNSVGKWNLRPGPLKKKPLAELHGMILERDSTMTQDKLPLTSDAAVEFLSQDYHPKQ